MLDKLPEPIIADVRASAAQQAACCGCAYYQSAINQSSMEVARGWDGFKLQAFQKEKADEKRKKKKKASLYVDDTRQHLTKLCLVETVNLPSV